MWLTLHIMYAVLPRIAFSISSIDQGRKLGPRLLRRDDQMAEIDRLIGLADKLENPIHLIDNLFIRRKKRDVGIGTRIAFVEISGTDTCHVASRRPDVRQLTVNL